LKVPTRPSALVLGLLLTVVVSVSQGQQPDKGELKIEGVRVLESPRAGGTGRLTLAGESQRHDCGGLGNRSTGRAAAGVRMIFLEWPGVLAGG
jgi:hypothetical protein